MKPIPAATRAQVYAAIDTEREYQEMRIVRDGTTAAPHTAHTPEEYLLYMEHYMFEARQVASTVWGPECRLEILDRMRKVVALGVACMEEHGAPARCN